MRIYYSASANSCFNDEWHAGMMPDDVIEITKAKHDEIVAGLAVGKQLKPDVNGNPSLVDPPAPTDADVAAQVRADRDARMRAFEWRYERYARETRLAQPPTDKLADLDAHMQALANVPEQSGFPGSVKWPVYPPVAAPAGGTK